MIGAQNAPQPDILKIIVDKMFILVKNNAYVTFSKNMKNIQQNPAHITRRMAKHLSVQSVR